ncbi:adenylate kinase family protein [Halobaculum sp. D14]|uniref:adenylate kinase family protein n=1 Tax=Halobaculum sp. D14 TaxID=3421642 RepID=UPI003EBD149E
MRIAVTGTPGTGKSTATDLLGDDYDVVHLNDVIREEGLTVERDEERDSLVADLDAVASRLDDYDPDPDAEHVVVDSHLAHRFDADRVVVLRCRPDVLEERLLDRGEPEPKARENRESEALDVVLAEAVDRHGTESVYEIDATDASPSEVAAAIEAVASGERDPSAGDVDFVAYR